MADPTHRSDDGAPSDVEADGPTCGDVVTPEGVESEPFDDRVVAVEPSVPRKQLTIRFTAQTAMAVLLAVPIVGVLVMGVARRWTSNGGFIYFRTVDQILAGHGPVYNAGERVEAFMSPVWLLLLTLGDVITPFRLEIGAAILSLACMAAALALATLGSIKVTRLDDPDGLLIPLGVAVFAVLWPVWIWSTGGTEVALTYLWIAVCLYLMATWAADSTQGAHRLPVRVTTLVIGGLGWVIRPELLASSVIFVSVLVVMSTSTRRQRWAMVGIAATIPVMYQVFRMGYYAVFVPNPVLTREALSPRPSTGWSYLVDFVGPYGLVVPVLAIAVGVAGPLVRRLWSRRLTRGAVVVCAVSVSGLVNAAILVLVGGDHIHARLMLPALFAFLAPFFVVAGRRRVVEAVAVIAVWLPICALVLRTDGSSSVVLGTAYVPGGLTFEDRGYPTAGPEQPGFVGPGLYTFDQYARRVSPTAIDIAGGGSAIAGTGAAVLGYVVGPHVQVIDLSGGGDVITSHQRSEVDWFVGLEKVGHAPWILAGLARDPTTVEPDAFTAGNDFAPDPSGLESLEQRAWAVASLQCGDIARLVEGSEDGLTASRFVDNLWNALPNTELRFDADARDAYVEHCGTRTPAAVSDFVDGVTVGSQIPASSEPGDVAIVDRCALTYFATESGAWAPIEEAANFTSALALSPTAGLARHLLYELGPYDDEGSNTEISVETDGAGHYRLRSDTDWFPPVVGTWATIPAEPVVVTIAPDAIEQEWSVFVGFYELVRLPMSTEDLSAVYVPAAVADPSTPVTQTQSEVSETCESFLPHELD